MHAPIETPCIKVCTIEPRTGYCRGCARTMAEIANWVGMGPANRAKVSEQLPARIKCLTGEPQSA